MGLNQRSLGKRCVQEIVHWLGSPVTTSWAVRHTLCQNQRSPMPWSCVSLGGHVQTFTVALESSLKKKTVLYRKGMAWIIHRSDFAHNHGSCSIFLFFLWAVRNCIAICCDFSQLLWCAFPRTLYYRVHSLKIDDLQSNGCDGPTQEGGRVTAIGGGWVRSQCQQRK